MINLCTAVICPETVLKILSKGRSNIGGCSCFLPARQTLRDCEFRNALSKKKKRKNNGPNLSSKAAIQAKSPNYVCWWRKRQRLATLCTNIHTHTHTHTRTHTQNVFSLKKLSCLREVTSRKKKRETWRDRARWSEIRWDFVRSRNV